LVDLVDDQQVTVWNLGVRIRTCCLDNGLALASWWHAVEEAFRALPEHPRAQEIAHFTTAILEELEMRVPQPTEFDRLWYRQNCLHFKCLTILGLQQPVTEKALKARWREIVKLHHPDRGGQPQEFIRLKAAYLEAKELLLDQEGYEVDED
jgi:hypothetical protein